MVHQVELGAERLPEPGSLPAEPGPGSTLQYGIMEESGWSAAESALGSVSEEQLRALVEGAAPQPELWAQSLAERAARLDTSNMAAMLTAAAAGVRLAERLQEGASAAGALRGRVSRAEELVRCAPAAGPAPARADHAQRRLLLELEGLFAWLDAPALQDLDAAPDLNTHEGRSRALQAGAALRTALRGEAAASPALRRLAATSERLRRLTRARERHAAALARHLNNLLIHLGNEAGGAALTALTALTLEPPRHHAELLPYAPFMRWLKEMDEKSFDALVKVYVGTWSRVHERAVHAWCEAARAPPSGPSADSAAGPAADCVLDTVLLRARRLCDAEQDFCASFLCLDYDPKAEASGDDSSSGGAGGAGAGGGAGRRGSSARRLFGELFPALEPELLALVAHIERMDQYGAMRALACASRHVLGEGGVGGAGGVGGEGGAGAGGTGRWAGAAVAAAAVAAKRAADRAVAERLAAMPDAIKQAQKKPKCGVLSFVAGFEEWAAACEGIFERGRRADLERCYGSLLGGALEAIAGASHPRTPRPVIQLENYHRLHGVLSMLRVPALEAWRREARARYSAALQAYVSAYFGRPLEGLSVFIERVGEALAAGARPHEVRYRPACSRQELRRVLPLYRPQDVRRALHTLYRQVDKHVSDGGLLQVVWRAMQEELLAQHAAIAARLAECYPGPHTAMPLTTQDILDAFSDIAREH